MISRRAVLAGLAGTGLAATGLSGSAGALDRQEPRPLPIEAAPFASFSAGDRDRRQFGALTFLGGLELRSGDPEFGGLSGLVLDPNGERFLVITDHAHWITGRIKQKDGVPLGIEAARIGPLRAPDGRRLKDTRYFDCESVFRQGQTLFVGVERVHDILQFDLNAGGEPIGRARLTGVPAEMKTLMPNGGIEALGLVPPGSEWSGHLLALAEKEARGQARGQIPGFLVGPKPGRLWLRRIGDFDVTDLAFLPDGDLLVLERRFVPLFGVGFRIRRIPLAMIRPGAVLDGPALIVADLSMQIDNMEGLAVHRTAQGRTILTLVSDNNFSLLQRNLMLRFALDG
ncbi:MAG: esterase-like activity of phytase family protein [Beijerinckiaceae bacterium]|nr:esterase-like activity of phytase family protein [Beijerinckiaceae bacterium]